MVKLPEVPLNIGLSEAPRSSVSASDVARPYAEMAQALGKAGKAAMDVAVPLAEQAGYEAVSHDAEGNIQITQLPFVGRAGDAYHRAVKFTALAKGENEARIKNIEMRQQFADDPQGYLKAGETFAEEQKKKFTQTAGPEVGIALARSIGASVAQTYNGLLSEKGHRDLKMSYKSLVARASDLDNQLAALARQGGTDTPEYNARLMDLKAIYGELTGNHLYGISKDAANSDLSQMASRHQAEAIIGTADRLYDKSGKAEARQFLEKAMWDPALNLTEAQRQTYVGRGMAALDARTAAQTAEIKAFRGVVSEQLKMLQSGGYIDPRSQSDILKQAVKLGDVESVYKLESWNALNHRLRAFNAASEPERRRMMETAQSGALIMAPKNLTESQRQVHDLVVQEAKKQGVDPKLASMVAWRESRLGANTAQPKSSAEGVFQMLKATREKYGVAEKAAVGDQVRGGVASLKDTITALRSTLGHEPSAAEVYMGHFLGAGTATSVLRAPADANLKTLLDQARPGWTDKEGRTWGDVVVAANPYLKGMTAGQMRQWAGGVVNTAYAQSGAAMAGPNAGVFSPSNPYSQVAVEKLVNDYRSTMSASLNQQVDGMIEAMKKRQLITPEEIGTVAYWVQQTGNFAAGRKLADFLETYDSGSSLAALPAAQRAAALAALRAKAATTGLNPAHRATLDFLTQQDGIRAKALKDDPLTEFATRGWTPPPPNVDVAKPAELAGALAKNEQAISAAQARDPSIGPVAALPKAQLTALGQQLVQGDATQAAQALGVMQQTLSPEVYRATLASPPIKAAIDGMVRSYDPVRLSAGMSALDLYYRSDPIGFQKAFDGGTMKRLQVWQAWKDSASPVEVAERFKRADDPAMANARKALGEQAVQELKSMKPADVAASFGTSWIPFTGPSAPADSLQAQRMLSEYDTLYRGLREFGVDPEPAKAQAIQRMQTVWGASDINGGALMRFPPERYYPANPFDGGHAWMRKQILEMAAQFKSEPVAAKGATGILQAGKMAPWVLKGLVSDSQTEAEIARGKPPSYHIVITDLRTGRDEVLTDPTTGASRFAFDPSEVSKAASGAFNEKRDRVMTGIADTEAGGGPLTYGAP